MTGRIELFFDCSSPWTYLAFMRLRPLAERTGAEIVWKPILVGGVFNEVNREVYERRASPNPVKDAYTKKDLQDWARVCRVVIGEPPAFPVKAVKAMRGAVVAEEAGRVEAYAAETFKAYWSDLEDISQDAVLARICRRAGLDEGAFFAAIASDAVKARLRANTDELIRRGGFGSPTMFVNGDDMYFGNDRLPLVEAALARAGLD